MAPVETLTTTPDPDDGKQVDANAIVLEDGALPVSKLPAGRAFEVLKSWVLDDLSHLRPWRKDATEWLAFRAGEQWSEDDKAILRDQKRPVIVFNRVLTILKAVAGMEINGRHEIHYIPRGTEDTAPNEILSAASKWMGDTTDGEDEESQAFDKCATTGLGFVENRMSYDEDSAGLYVEESIDPREMGWDRAARKKNLKDARRMWRQKSVPLREAMRLFKGKTRDEIDATWAIDLGFSDPQKSIEMKRRRDGVTVDDVYDDKCEVMIVEIQWFEHEPYWLVADTATNQKIEMSDAKYKILQERMKLLGVGQLEAVQLSRKIYKRAFLGEALLREIKDAPIKGRYSWDAITGEFDDVKRSWFGLVKVMRDPQMWANKWMAQILHILNTTAKGGILAEEDAFEDIREAEESYAQSDQITAVAKGALSNAHGPKIIAKPGAGAADGYIGLLTFAISSIKDVTGINLELLGQQDQNQPGILEAMRKQAGMTVLATLFDSLRGFRKGVGRSRLYFIQTCLSDGRLIRVAGPTMAKPEAVALAKDRTAGTYDVVVDDTPTSPNQKEANWAIIQPLLAIFKEQLMANPEVLAILMEYSPLPARVTEAIKMFIQKAQNDPKAQQEQQENRKLLVDQSLASIAKDQSTASLNLSKAKGTEADMMQSIAMARNLLEDNKKEELRAWFDAQIAQASSERARAEAVTAQTKAQAEQQKLMFTAAEAEGTRADRAAERQREDARLAIEHMATMGTLDKDTAAAIKLRVEAERLKKTPIENPNKKPAGAK